MTQSAVAFQGVPGANSEQALRQHFGSDVATYPCPTLSAMFEAIGTGQVHYALLPVENAQAGAVQQSYELLMDSDLRIQAEIIMHVHFALMAPQGVAIDAIKRVRSHPQALAQCERY